jgi:NAD(P)-dependent dehydrogenase (short-subunit alcohol dehydrogenase family)
MAGRLQDKVALVTGAGTGIGEAIAKRFALEGAKLVLVGRPGDPVERVCAEIGRLGGHSVFVRVDVATETGAKHAVATAVREWGGLDVLVNDAGVLPKPAPLDEFPVEDFEWVLRNNVGSVFHMTRAAWPELVKRRGNVVCAGSEAGLIGEPQIAAYAGTKGFVHAFVRTTAMEGTKVGVRVNAVAPGPIDTQMTDPKTGPIDQKFAQDIERGTPMGRRGTPEEVANAYLFLASDEASYVTGHVLSVDGGSAVGKGNLGEEVPEEFKQYPPSRIDLRHQFEGGAKML